MTGMRRLEGRAGQSRAGLSADTKGLEAGMSGTCSALRIFSICRVSELREVPCFSSNTAFSACDRPACSKQANSP